MKTIPLTRGQVAIVDDEDFARFGHLKWHAVWSQCTKSFYAMRNGPRPRRKSISLHGAIMGHPPRTDHENHDTLDCRRQNLRACTPSQNSMNRRGAQANSKSGVRGVCWRPRFGKWEANIRVNNRQKFLGMFFTKTAAAAAYAVANRQHFGAFGGEL